MTGGMNTFIWLFIFVAITYFMMIKPQQKQRKQRDELLASLEKGDQVITIGGIFGTIKSLDEESMVLEVAKDIKIKMQRSAVGSVVVPDEDNAE